MEVADALQCLAQIQGRVFEIFLEELPHALGKMTRSPGRGKKRGPQRS
jgi:hypothetical protein